MSRISLVRHSAPSLSLPSSNTYPVTQVAPGVWTYIELGIGITSGNLPLLRPLFGRFLGIVSKNGSTPTYGNGSKPISYPLSRVTGTSSANRPDGFHRMDKSANEVDVESLGSEVELNKTTAERGTPDWKGEGIKVKTDVDLRIEEIRECIETEVRRTQERMPSSASKPPYSSY